MIAGEIDPGLGHQSGEPGFRQFSLRGLQKVKGEWDLVALAWNLKRMYVLAE